jgi:isocitrate dehydrogenase
LPDGLPGAGVTEPKRKDDTMKICVLPGDGIGPEIMAQAVRVLDDLRATVSASS